MSAPMIYLSGPIAGQSYAGAVNWYGRARGLLPSSIDLLAPMRGKEFLRGEERLGQGPVPQSVMATGAAITGRDRWDTQRCSAVLMNLTEARGRVSIGCMIEAGWADAARVPIVLCMEPGNVHEGHAILEHVATYRTSDLSDACRILAAMFCRELPC